MILQKKKMGKKILRYKQCLDILDFSTVKEQLPLIAGIPRKRVSLIFLQVFQR